MDLTLRETGNLLGVIDYYFYRLHIMARINEQIIHKAKELRHSEKFSYDFKNAYNFRDYLFCFEGGVVGGLFTGYAEYYDDIIRIYGTIEYEYSDTFTDPLSIREWAHRKEGKEFLRSKEFKRICQWVEQNIGSELRMTAYNITDTWTTRFEAEVRRKN